MSRRDGIRGVADVSAGGTGAVDHPDDGGTRDTVACDSAESDFYLDDRERDPGETASIERPAAVESSR